MNNKYIVAVMVWVLLSVIVLNCGCITTRSKRNAEAVYELDDGTKFGVAGEIVEYNFTVKCTKGYEADIHIANVVSNWNITFSEGYGYDPEGKNITAGVIKNGQTAVIQVYVEIHGNTPIGDTDNAMIDFEIILSWMAGTKQRDSNIASITLTTTVDNTRTNDDPIEPQKGTVWE